MSVTLAAYVLPGTDTAEDVLHRVSEAGGPPWLDDVAIIRRSHTGRVFVHSTWAETHHTDKGEVSWGAMTGAVVRALTGPGGALAGLLAGGSTKGIAAALELSSTDPAFDALTNQLTLETSALLLVGESVPSFVETFAADDGTMIYTEIAEHLADQIHASLHPA